MQIGTLISMLNKQKKKATEVMINVNGILYPVKRTEVKDKCIVLEVEPSLDAPQRGTEEGTAKEKAGDSTESEDVKKTSKKKQQAVKE